MDQGATDLTPHLHSMADHHRTKGPLYQVGQQVWLSTRCLPLKSDCRKLAPRFIGLFPVSKLINPLTARLKLPRSMKVHPTFHMSQVKPLVWSPLVLATPNPSIVDGKPVYTAKRQPFAGGDGEGDISLTGRVMDLRRELGYQPPSSWTPTSFENSMTSIQTNQVRQEPSLGGGVL